MKKLLVLLILLVSMTSFAKETLVKSYDQVPLEIQGVWYVIAASESSGLIQGQALFNLTRKHLTTKYLSLEVIAVDKHKDGEVFYVIFTEDTTKKFILGYEQGNPILYALKNDTLVFKALISIRQ